MRTSLLYQIIGHTSGDEYSWSWVSEKLILVGGQQRFNHRLPYGSDCGIDYRRQITAGGWIAAQACSAANGTGRSSSTATCEPLPAACARPVSRGRIRLR